MGHGGRDDVRRHGETDLHERSIKQTNTKSVSTYFTGQTQLEKDTLSTEIIFCNFIAEHNLPFAVADHFTHLCKNMFLTAVPNRKRSTMNL